MTAWRRQLKQVEDILDIQDFTQCTKRQIVIHTEHVEHDMNDDTGEGTRTMRNITNANGEQIDIVIENEKTEAEAEGN